MDGEYWKTLDADRAAELGVFEDSEFTPDELARIGVAGEHSLALRRAVNFLGHRPRSEGEVRARLQRFEHEATTVENVVRKLHELDYLDDEQFARDLANERARKKGWGPRRILTDLRQRDIPATLAERVIEEELTDLSEEEAARETAAKKYNTSLHSLFAGDGTSEGGTSENTPEDTLEGTFEERRKLSRRVYQYLLRRGYSGEVSAVVAREYGKG